MRGTLAQCPTRPAAPRVPGLSDSLLGKAAPASDGRKGKDTVAYLSILSNVDDYNELKELCHGKVEGKIIWNLIPVG